MSKLYLIPCPIADNTIGQVLPANIREIVGSLDYFIVENVRSARRFLSALGISRRIDELEFAECNEHTRPEEIEELIAPLVSGRSAGFISEAGMPAIADPGADIAAACHRQGIEVVPLVGPSSIILALAASGQNGQSFAFNGYLPIKQPARNQAIKRFETRARVEHQAQIFIEAPYRNIQLLGDILAVCYPDTMLTIATAITSPEQFIRSLPISQWSKLSPPELHKRATIFIIGDRG
jgi:16S rRNA (cytidine1402-2'-O)-methyltransferase